MGARTLPRHLLSEPGSRVRQMARQFNAARLRHSRLALHSRLPRRTWRRRSSRSRVRLSPVGFPPSVAGLPGGNIVEGPFAVTGVVTSGAGGGGGDCPASGGLSESRQQGVQAHCPGLLHACFDGNTDPHGRCRLGLQRNRNGYLHDHQRGFSSGTTASDWEIDLILRTAATGATGTIEAHGHTFAGLVTGTANLGAVNIDNTIAPSSAGRSLTKQDYIRVTINSGTAKSHAIARSGRSFSKR